MPVQPHHGMGSSTSYLLSLSILFSPSLQLELFPLVDGMVDMVELYYNPPSLETSRDRVAEQSRGVGSGERGISAALSFPFLLFFLSTFPVLRALGRLESGKLKRKRPGHSLGLPPSVLPVYTAEPLSLSPLHLLAPRRGVVCLIGRARIAHQRHFIFLFRATAPQNGNFIFGRPTIQPGRAEQRGTMCAASA